jgi:hypothetical protein
MKSKKFTFGQIRDIPAGAEESRIIPFVLSTSRRDRHGTVLNQDNWSLDNYRNNPIVGFMHNLYGDMCNPPDPDDVVGKSRSIDVEGKKGSRQLIAEAEFEPADLNLQAEKVFRKILFGSLHGASVGFLPTGKGWYGEKDEDQGNENETYYFEGQELLEWSVVNIPSNPDGAKRVMRDQAVSAIAYVHRALGAKFRLSQIEEMRVRDVLDLLDGKDIEIRETDPEKVRRMLMEELAIKDMNNIITRQQAEFKKKISL